MLDRWQVISLGLILSLPVLHYGGDFYLHSIGSQTLRDQISMMPNIFAILGTALFLVKGGLSYKAIEKMISKSPVVGKYYKHVIVTNISLATVVLYSDLTAFFGLAMFSIVIAYGTISGHQLEVYNQVQIYAYIFVPAVSLVSFILERLASASRKTK